MDKLVNMIINTMYPKRGSAYIFESNVSEHYEPMKEKLLKLEDREIIKLYDIIVHQHYNSNYSK
jgi:hypothetical protein